MKKIKYLTAALCAVVLLCGLTLPAYAGGSEAWEDVEPAEQRPVQTTEPTPTPTPTPDPTPAPTVEPTPTPKPTPAVTTPPAAAPTTTGTATKPVTSGNKGSSTTQKPTTDTEKPENTDTPKEEESGTGGVDWEGLEPANPLTPDGQGSVLNNATGEEDKEFFTVTTAEGEVFYLVIDRQKAGENVYFLNAVTVSDLMALAEESGAEIIPAVTPEPEPEPTPTPDPEPEPEPEGKGGFVTLLLALAVVAVGGGAGWYFKIYRPKQQRAADLEDDYAGEPDYGDGGDDYEDGPPWDTEGDE